MGMKFTRTPGSKVMSSPLADILRPMTLDDVIGQRHLMGPGKPLRLMAQTGKFISSIIWGTPGSGKTTVVRAMARDAGARTRRPCAPGECRRCQ